MKSMRRVKFQQLASRHFLLHYHTRAAVWAVVGIALFVGARCWGDDETVNELIRKGHYKKALEEESRAEGPDSAKYRALKQWIASGYNQNLERSDTDLYSEPAPVPEPKRQTRFSGDIKEGWDEGRQVSAVAITDKKGFGVMSSGTGYTAQSWASRGTFAEMKEWITEQEANGFLISAFSTTGKLFFCVMSKGTPYTNQTWIRRTNIADVRKWIGDQWENGYDVTTAAMDGTAFFVVVSKGSGIKGQKWALRDSYEGIRNWIEEGWKEDYYLTAIDNDGTNYLAVMSKGMGWTNQSYKVANSTDELSTWIKSKWDTDYKLTSVMVMTNDRRLAVMSRGTRLTGQQWFINDQ